MRCSESRQTPSPIGFFNRRACGLPMQNHVRSPGCACSLLSNKPRGRRRGGSPIRWAGERREPHLAGSASAFSHGTDVFLHINPISRREHGFSCKYQRAHRPARSSQCRHRAALVPRHSGPLGQAAGRQGASQSAVAYRRRRILRQPRHEHRRSHHCPAAGFGMVGQQPELHLRIDDGVRLSDRWNCWPASYRTSSGAGRDSCSSHRCSRCSAWWRPLPRT